ncbi:MAG TPA: TIM barrel protein [Chitinophaga sp.]
MKIKILSALWGYESLGMPAFLLKIKAAGFDGVDTWIPENPEDRQTLYRFLEQHGLTLVTHQHQARGATFQAFKASFKEYLHHAAAPRPLFINSHTGRDYFSFAQNLELIDIALDFSAKTGIEVVHETHRGRLGYAPQQLEALFAARPQFHITADLSHWVCVTESLLEGYTGVLQHVFQRARHVHARVGYEEGPQVPDPRAPEWAYALHQFLEWWDAIILHNKDQGRAVMTLTPEFGPPPYMHTLPYSQTPVADLFGINCYMKDLLHKRYTANA